MSSGTRKLTVEVVGDSTSGVRAIKNTKSAADSLVPSALTAKGGMEKLTNELTNRLPIGGSAAKAVLTKVTGALTEMGPGMQAAAGGAAVVGAVLIKMAGDGIQSFIKLTGEARSYQRVTASSAEDSSKLAAEMRAMGIDADTGAGLMGKFAKQIGTHSIALKENGIQIAKNADGTVNMTATLANGAEAFKNSKSATEQSAIGNAMFGRGWVTLTPILMKGKDGLKELNEEAAKHHEIFNQKDIDSGTAFKVSLRQMHEAVDSLERGIGEGLVPVLTQAITSVTAVIGPIDSASRAFGGMTGVIKGVADVALPGAQAFLPWGDHAKSAGEKAKEAADNARHLSDAQLQVASSSGADSAATDELKARQEAATAKEKIRTDGIKKLCDAIDRQIGASRTLVGGSLSLEDAVASTAAATADYNAAVLINTASHGKDAAAVKDLDDKGRALEHSLDAQAQAAATLSDTQATLAGHTHTAAESADVYKLHLIDLANQVGGPMRDRLLSMAAQIVGVTGEKNLHITADNKAALSAIDQIRQGLNATVRVDAAFGVAHGKMASGGSFNPGLFLVGEEGPEMVRFGQSGEVIPNKRIAGMMGSSPGGSSGAPAINIYAMSPNPADISRAVIEAITVFERANGPVFSRA